jgi:hypothetical protein
MHFAFSYSACKTLKKLKYLIGSNSAFVLVHYLSKDPTLTIWIWICITRFHAILNLDRLFLIKRLILNTAKSRHFRSNLSDHNRTVWMQYCLHHHPVHAVVLWLTYLHIFFFIDPRISAFKLLCVCVIVFNLRVGGLRTNTQMTIDWT